MLSSQLTAPLLNTGKATCYGMVEPVSSPAHEHKFKAGVGRLDPQLKKTPPAKKFMKDLKSLIAELREKANAATPGPWKTGERNAEGKLLILHNGMDISLIQPWMTHDEPNAAFIAACDPQTILRLCDEIERLQIEIYECTEDD